MRTMFKPANAKNRLLSLCAFSCLIVPAINAQQPTSLPAENSAAQQSGFINQAVYEVVSIHKFKADGVPTMMSWKTDPDGLTITHNQIKSLICMAYGVSYYQVLGGPEWVSSDFYDVHAKMDEETMNTMHALPSEQAKLARQHMAQALLAERFKLTVHHETRQFPMYKLVVAKGGPKLHEAKTSDDHPKELSGADGKPSGKGTMLMHFDSNAMLVTAQEYSMDGLAQQLSAQLESQVQNTTGLKGNYDFTLRWASESMRLEAANPSTGSNVNLSEDGAPSIFDALQEQLGLKLESQKGPLDVIVIDHIEQPTEN